MRLIFFKTRNTFSAPLFQNLNILNVYQINLFRTLQFMFSVKNGTCPTAFANYFQLIFHKYETRSLKHNFSRTSSSSKCTSFRVTDRGTRLWNSLNDSEKSAKSLKEFKTIVKSVIINLDENVLFSYF